MMGDTTHRPAGSVLVVDDDPGVAGSIRDLLEDEGFGVEVASAGLDALESLARRRPALVVLDVMLPDIYGEGVANAVRSAYRDVPIVLTSGLPVTSDEMLAVKAAAFVRKPFDADKLLEAVHHCLAVIS